MPFVDTEQPAPEIERDPIKAALPVMAYISAYPFSPITPEQPANFIPIAKLQGPLDNQVGIALQVQEIGIVFFEVGSQSARDTRFRFWLMGVIHMEIVSPSCSEIHTDIYCKQYHKSTNGSHQIML